MRIDTTKPYARLTITGDEEDQISVDDIGLFLYDFATLYELTRLALDPKYESFKFSRFALYRNGRPVKENDDIYIEKITHSSPLELIAQVALTSGVALGALWTLVQLIEKIYNIPLNRKKLKLDTQNSELDVTKKELEVAKLRRELQLSDEDFEEQVLPEKQSSQEFEQRKAMPPIRTILRRLKRSAIQIEEIELEIVDPESDAQSLKAFHDWLEGKDRRRIGEG